MAETATADALSPREREVLSFITEERWLLLAVALPPMVCLVDEPLQPGVDAMQAMRHRLSGLMSNSPSAWRECVSRLRRHMGRATRLPRATSTPVRSICPRK